VSASDWQEIAIACGLTAFEKARVAYVGR